MTGSRFFLKPFKVATEGMSTDKYPTASAVLPLKHVLLRLLSKQRPDESETHAVTEIMTAISTDLAQRYSDGEGTHNAAERSG